MQLVPLAISIAVLAGIWTYVSAQLNILTWPAFVGWALFFAAGGNDKAFFRALLPAVSGMVLGYLAVLGAPYLGKALGVAILVTVIAFIMTVMGSLSLFTFVPAQFAACAAFFGTGAKFWPTVIPMAIGVGLGYLSAMLPVWLTPKKAGKETAGT
jgi:hypothetical protein